MSAVASAPFVGIKVKEEEEATMVVLPDLMEDDSSSAKRKFEIEEEKKPEITGSPIKFREFASVSNMEASASKRPKLVTTEKKVVTTEKKLATENGEQRKLKEKYPGSKIVGKESEKQQKVVEKAMVNIVGYSIHYQMSGGVFYLEKAAVVAMLNGKGVPGEFDTERIGDVEFVLLKSLESAVKDSAQCEDDAAFKSSLLSRDAIQCCHEIHVQDVMIQHSGGLCSLYLAQFKIIAWKLLLRNLTTSLNGNTGSPSLTPSMKRSSAPSPTSLWTSTPTRARGT